MSENSRSALVERWAQIHASGHDMATTLGIEPVDETDDCVILRLAHSPAIQQPTGLFSAASLFALADVAGTMLSIKYIRGEGFPLAAQSNINLLGNTNRGYATATASVVKAGSRLIVTETKVTGDDGQLLANVTTTYIQPRG